MGIDKARIKEVPLFKDLSDEFLGRVAQSAEEKDFKDGSIVTHEGCDADEFYFVEEGQLNILSEKWQDLDDRQEQNPVPIQTISKGQMLGWSWFLKSSKWSFSSQALGDCRLIAIKSQPINDYLESHPAEGFEVAKRLIGIMKERIVATRMNLALYAGKPFVSVEGG